MYSKKLRKVITLIACIVMALGILSACGGNEPNAEGKKAYITIECKTAAEMKSAGKLKASVAEVVPDDGIILPRTEITLKKGDTALEMLLRTTREREIHTSYQGDTSYGAAYVEAIGNLFEKDCGKKSGWMYKVDGKYPNYGSDKLKLKGGEEILWIYTCNNGKDIAAKLEE